MTLRENYKIENDGIWIAKKELEEWRDHYLKIASDPNKQDAYRWLFHGKADALIDLLKMFEP